MIPDDVFKQLHQAPPEKVMDLPEVSSFWRRRAALMLGLWPNTDWGNIIGAVEHREYARDQAFAGELALRHLRLDCDRQRAALEALVAAGILDDAKYGAHWAAVSDAIDWSAAAADWTTNTEGAEK